MLRASLLILLTLLVTGIAVLPRAANAQEAPSPVIISGGDLPRAVQLAFADEDAFLRRINLPPLFDEPPDVTGDAYTITSDYWDTSIRNGREGRATVDDAATYYPEGGYVRARQGGLDVWLVLDLRQRAILDRYIRLMKADLLPRRPGELHVLALASRSEPININIGGRPLSDGEAKAFWNGVLFTPGPSVAEPPSPPTGVRGTWLVFGLSDGRTLQFLYNRESSLLIDSFGYEIYMVVPPVADSIAALGLSGRGGIAVEQQAGTGSPLWWLIMLGGGLTCIGAALWLRRRISGASTSP